jgi:hypothetical protein
MHTAAQQPGHPADLLVALAGLQHLNPPPPQISLQTIMPPMHDTLPTLLPSHIALTNTSIPFLSQRQRPHPHTHIRLNKICTIMTTSGGLATRVVSSCTGFSAMLACPSIPCHHLKLSSSSHPGLPPPPCGPFQTRGGDAGSSSSSTTMVIPAAAYSQWSCQTMKITLLISFINCLVSTAKAAGPSLFLTETARQQWP